MSVGYSKSPAASVKKTYDLQIMDNDVRNSAGWISRRATTSSSSSN